MCRSDGGRERKMNRKCVDYVVRANAESCVVEGTLFSEDEESFCMWKNTVLAMMSSTTEENHLPSVRRRYVDYFVWTKHWLRTSSYNLTVA